MFMDINIKINISSINKIDIRQFLFSDCLSHTLNVMELKLKVKCNVACS